MKKITLKWSRNTRMELWNSDYKGHTLRIWEGIPSIQVIQGSKLVRINNIKAAINFIDQGGLVDPNYMTRLVELKDFTTKTKQRNKK